MGLLVSFSGIDGAGKSTQIELLVKALKERGFKVNAGESMFTYFLLKPIIGILRSATSSPSDGPVKRNNNLIPKLWFLFAFADIWVGYILKIRPMVDKYDFVIADRFYTDIWANLLYYGYCPDWAFRFLIKLLPKADIAFMLQADPKIVQKREQEFPPNYYEEQTKIYKRLSTLIKFNIINANLQPRIVFKNLLPIVLQGIRTS